MYNNVLIFSDIHINDYANFNRSKEARLFQNRVLASLIKDAGVKYGCSRFIIAGDTVDIPVMKNNILNEVKSFLYSLCSHFTLDNYIIYGQHDLSTKDMNQDPRFSGLTAILPPNLIYSDMRQFELCGRRVAMMNWKPVQDLSWIDGVVDLFVGHVTLSPEGAKFKGQDIDQSKFKLSITGDIHKHFTKGKMVSIGSCQQNKLGDQMESTAIVWNPIDNSWKCIDLDPNHKLLRLRYTPDRSKEGFDPNENYYNIYRPIKIESSESDIINIPKWAEISELVDKVIYDNGLILVHEEVLKHVKMEDDVDFGFIPIRLRLKDFRSIDNAEIYFDDGDKISISGNNGSGKSSLILGLYNALRENRSLKDFVRFGATDCECEFEFIYQGVNNRILRGTKNWGCWINGEKLPYNNKREFEEDMLRRFSFLNYTDVFFFNADRSTIIGSMNPERKSELISKLFKINKVDYYNSTARLMMDDTMSLISGKLDEMSRLRDLANYLENQLRFIEVPSMSLDDLQRLHSDMTNAQKSYYEYTKYKADVDKLNGMIESSKEQVSKCLSRMNSIDIDKITKRKSEIELALNEARSQSIRRAELKSKADQIRGQINRLNSDGSKVYSDLMKAKSNICPTCGQHIQSKELENSLSARVNQLISERDELEKDLNIIEDELNNIKFYDERMFSEDLNKISSEIGEYNSMSNQVANLNKSILRYTNDLISIGQDRSFNVTSLPDDFYDQLNKINSDIIIWNNYNGLKGQLDDVKSKIPHLENEIKGFQSNISLLEKYIKLTSSTGDIYREIMVKISKDFSDGVIRYEVNQYRFRNKDHLDLDVQYNVAGRWVNYQSLSSGQKTMADINFLSRILVECGLLVFDETLKHLSQSSTEYCLDIMSRMNVHAMILTTHMYGTESFSNKDIQLELDDKGITKIEVKC